MDCVKEVEGCPRKLITDLGTENVLAAAMQTFSDKILMVTSTYPHQEINVPAADFFVSCGSIRDL